MNYKQSDINATRVKELANLDNANTLKLSYFDKRPDWLLNGLNKTIVLHNGKITVEGQTKQAEPGDYLVLEDGNIEIYTHQEIMQK